MPSGAGGYDDDRPPNNYSSITIHGTSIDSGDDCQHAESFDRGNSSVNSGEYGNLHMHILNGGHENYSNSLVENSERIGYSSTQGFANTLDNDFAADGQGHNSQTAHVRNTLECEKEVIIHDSGDKKSGRGRNVRLDENKTSKDGIHETPKSEEMKQTCVDVQGMTVGSTESIIESNEEDEHGKIIASDTVLSIDGGSLCSDKQAGKDGSLDDTLWARFGRPQHKDAATLELNTDASDGKNENFLSSSEMTPPQNSKSNQFTPSPTATASETTSLLTKGMSLFTRSSRQVRPARYENDANSVISEMSQVVKLASNSDKNDDDALRQHLEESGLVLLKRLIEFLSECPPASDEGTENPFLSGRSMAKSPKKRHRGLTLPACAIGWLSTQIYNSDNDGLTDLGECYRVPNQQLRCIESLFKRVTSLRISGEAWPPPMSAPGKAAGDIVSKAKRSIAANLLSKFSGDQSSMAGDSADDASCETTSTVPSQIYVSPFRRYYQDLQSSPRVNMSFFPNATKVVIDGIPPSWLTNLDSLKILEMFQLEKGCILDINQLFFPSDSTENNHNEEGRDASPVVYFSLSKLRLSHCAIGETAGLRGRRAIPRLPAFSRFPNLVSLNLSHNELFKTKTALAGLSSLPQLSSLNLSYNRFSSLDDVYMYIGNVTELFLTGNSISSTRGLDRIFSLEHLTLDENRINQLTHIVGIAKLPFLMNLDVKGNPFEIDDPASSRVKVFNLFREVRCSNLPKDATFRDMQRLLPVLDKELATKEELVALKDLTFRTTAITMDSMPTDNKDGNTDSTKIDEISILMPDPSQGRRCVVKSSRTTLAHLRMTGSTALDVNHGRQRLERYRGEAKSDENRQVSIQFNMKELITSIRPEFDICDYYVVGGERSQNNLRARSFSSHTSEGKDKNAVESSSMNFPFALPSALLAEADDDTWNPTTLLDHIVPSDTIVWEEMIVEDAVRQDDDGEATETQSSLPSLGNEQGRKSEEEVDPVGNDTTRADDGSVDTSRKSMFDGIWKQSYRDNVAKPALDDLDSTEIRLPESLDFSAMEEMSRFDGNPDLGALFVSNDLDSYFDSFIFPKHSSEDGKEDINSLIPASFAPRIQLYKFDRRSFVSNHGQHGSLSSMDYRERYIGVCKEYVLACGPYARSRVSPIRTEKRTFHGDTVTRAGKDVMRSESRRLILCLSESALYFIIDDEITSQKSTGFKRSFPSRIPPNATFSDAYWPHALIRHPLDCLRGITIGFQFQRLILRFSVRSPATSSSFEYTYVILTSNKSRTVSLLQKIDDCQLGMGALIDNDDKTFLDALGALGPNEVVLHYQILRQCWKRGDRSPPRRSFVLTDLKIYLIDEAYIGDGTDPDEEKGKGGKLGDVSLTIIDSAKLSRVTEVRAANEDPRKITLVILPQNKLKRPHRWRLICNDGEGAERLIDAVRKAIDEKA